MIEEPKKATEAFEKTLRADDKEYYTLRLYVSGMTPTSIRAIQNLEEICKQHLNGRYELEIIDIYQHPEKSRSEQVIAAPTLIKKIPLPLRRFIGDLSDKEKILVGLDLVPKKDRRDP